MFLVTVSTPNHNWSPNAQLTVAPDNDPALMIPLERGVYREVELPLTLDRYRQGTFNFKIALELGSRVLSSRAENVSTDGSLHFMVIRPFAQEPRPAGVGYLFHGRNKKDPVPVLVCPNDSSKKQTCPGSLDCDGLILIC